MAHLVMWLAALAAVPLSLARAQTDTVQPPATVEWPPVPREFRAAWIATVENIDWPSRPGLSTDEQQAELLKLVEVAADLHLNALIFQVRPCADAFYASELEPWSEYLTGTMGMPPDPPFDPLAFAIQAAHARGIELHAWINPFRAHHASSTRPLADNHIGVRRPDLVRAYGKYLWLDPGEQEATEHSLAVIADIVRRYDVDAIHFDDYFYPYPIEGFPFPDDVSWARAKGSASQGFQGTKEEWRRDNVDRFVARTAERIKAIKPWVRFGISPFGIWRPGYPEGIQGFDPFLAIHADSRKWLQAGWVDYLSPQLYWPIDQAPQSYSTLLVWWHTQNPLQRNIWPGNFTSRLLPATEKPWAKEEILRQIEVTRWIAPSNRSGNIHFSIKALAGNAGGLADELRTKTYAAPALVPASPWIKQPVPPRPALTWTSAPDGTLNIGWDGSEPPWLWVIRARCGEATSRLILPGHETHVSIPELKGSDLEAIVQVMAINRVGEQGPPAYLSRSPM